MNFKRFSLHFGSLTLCSNTAWCKSVVKVRNEGEARKYRRVNSLEKRCTGFGVLGIFGDFWGFLGLTLIFGIFWDILGYFGFFWFICIIKPLGRWDYRTFAFIEFSWIFRDFRILGIFWNFWDFFVYSFIFLS